MKKVRKAYGITLISLVITIIVLLILAGVSIAMLTGNNGILNQAKLAKENTEVAAEKEKADLENTNRYINEQIEKITPGDRVTTTKKNNYTDNNGEKATIPAGFTVSKIEEEQDIATGLVIYDIPESENENIDWTAKNDDGAYNVQTLYNQFVWIPITNVEEYKREFNYPSYYYINESWTSSETTSADSTHTDTGYLPTNIQQVTDNAKNNEEAEKNAVQKYNGFYIARYEAGNEDSNVVSKQKAEVYVNQTQEKFKAIGKTMYGENSTYVKSAMCSGIQWDMVMKFIDGKSDASNNIFDVRTYNSNRHKENGIETSGGNLADKVQNIYDLEGNCYEFVAERNKYKASYIFRAGAYNSGKDNRASLRYSDNGNADNNRTFRAVLYVMQANS